MRKLMAANLSRLKRDRVFWLALLVMFAYSVVNMLNGCRQATQDMSAYHYSLEQYYFAGMPMIGAFIAVFVSLFISVEHGEGTMRNKLIIGHTRGSVYLANLAVCVIASLAMLAVWCVGGLVGIPVLGGLELGGGAAIAAYLLTAALMTCSLCAIFVFAAMLTDSRAMSAVGCFLLWLALVLIGSYFYNTLSEPEMNTGVIVTAEGGMQMADPTPNPKYISGVKRDIYEFFADLFPTSQGIVLYDAAVERPLRMMLCSAVIAASCTALGLALFSRKDLK